MEQRIGKVVRTQGADLVQFSGTDGIQVVEGIEDSREVLIRQIAASSGARDLVHSAAAMAAVLDGLSSETRADVLGEVESLIREALGAAEITGPDVRRVRAELDADADADDGAGGASAGMSRLRAVVDDLGTALTLVSGGIAVSQLGDPIAVAVVAPLALALGGVLAHERVRAIYRSIGDAVRRRLAGGDRAE